MPTQAKVDRVAQLKEKLENSAIVISTGFTGMGVNQMVDLRRRLREGGVEFVVIKNNLLDLAADAAGIPQLKDIVSGQTGIALGYADPAQAAKTVTAAAAAGGILSIGGAIIDQGDPMPPTEVSRLAALPPQPVLVAMLLGGMQAPLYGLLGILSGPVRSLGYLLQARVDQLQQSEEAA